MKDPKLNPCRCGKEAKVEYIAGLGRGVIEYVNNPFKSGFPTYYIHCPVCNRNLCIRLDRGLTAEYRDKCRRKLIRRWNEAMQADSIPTNTKKVYTVIK